MKLADLFCCAGGAAKGYADAGFEPVGFDIKPQPNYPYEFIQLDVMSLQPSDFAGFDAIHASPPCQAFTAAKSIRGNDHLDLLTPIREVLKQTDVPWVIENVPGAPMRRDLVLCGSMFTLEHRGFGLRRHRWFELSDPTKVPLVSPCWHRLPPMYVYGHGADLNHKRKYGPTSVADWRAVMGIDWMTQSELAQAIPPAYTRFIGEFLAT